MRNMSFRQLEILRSVIKCKTTISAAKELGLSQPTVSNAIKNMEAQVGFALFERVNSRLYPTQEANIISAESEAIFALHSSLDVRIRDLQQTRAGVLNILSTPPLGYSLIPPTLRRFLRKRTKVRVSFEVRQFEHVIDSVEKNVVDLGFVLGLPIMPSLSSEVLSIQDMVCVFQPGHPLTCKSVIRPGDLQAHSLVGLEQNSRLGALVRNSFELEGFRYDSAVEVRHGSTACVLAESGIGVAVVDPLSALASNRSALEVRPFEPSTPVAASVIWTTSRPLSRLAQEFMKEVKSVLANGGPTADLQQRMVRT
ncbi:LysR substrate-binding domain-containing protein [Bradyrhizobium sp. AZCC 2289]|uniref:LysR substrate-binding domain-containing protein n=1 Tax=Bradyrhizobium sp. AZCC 2289 TaxID=3117026 RepID=UPI002FEF383B